MATMDITAESVNNVADILIKLSDLNITETSVRDFVIDLNLDHISDACKTFFSIYLCKAFS